MDSIIKIPFINPVKYTQIGYDQLPQYLSRHMDDYPYIDAIRSYEQVTNYFQIWGGIDSIRQQLFSNIGPVSMNVVNCQGETLLTTNWEQKQEDANNPTLFRYDSDLDLNPFGAGVFFLQLDFNGLYSLISEPLVLSESLEETVLIEFVNLPFYDNMIFEDGFTPTLRIAGQMKFKEPGSKRIIYEDDPLNAEILDSKNFRSWTFLIGGVTGIPDYMIDKVNRILGCNDLRIDGRNFTVDPGGKLENENLDGYPMRGWRIDMREKYNRASKYFSTDVNTDNPILMLANVDSKGFIKDDAGGSFFQIIDVD